MANISTITYNGKVIAETEEAGNVVVTYGGKTIANMGAGETKTFSCNGKVMKTNLYIGAKTLLCEMSQMISDVIVAVKSAFPEAPSSYVLIGKYTSNQTWTAPEDGYFQIEVFGASGKGGAAAGVDNGNDYRANGGGGGGGGGYACSRVKLKKGDTVSIVRGSVGATSSATINSSVESYSKINVTSGATGGNATTKLRGWGEGGSGGVATGGNYANEDGYSGQNGDTEWKGTDLSGSYVDVATGTGGDGGDPGYTGGTTGGQGGTITGSGKKGQISLTSPKSGAAGFFKIYRGNTNVVA